uniref:RING-type domain-containing protein n=1 Tax=Steinernema glaseri TaxID=37863 RepID=A0A1I8AD62_9BILA
MPRVVRNPRSDYRHRGRSPAPSPGGESLLHSWLQMPEPGRRSAAPRLSGTARTMRTTRNSQDSPRNRTVTTRAQRADQRSRPVPVRRRYIDSESEESDRSMIIISDDEDREDESMSSESESSAVAEVEPDSQSSRSDESLEVESSRAGDETDEDMADDDLSGVVFERSNVTPERESRRSAAPPPVDEGPATPLDVVVHECIVCMSAITSEGGHRAVALKCGHLFGKQCVEQWIRTASKSCPSCKSKATMKDLRLIYARTITAEDNGALLEAQQRASNLVAENTRLLEKNDELERKLKERAVAPAGPSGSTATGNQRLDAMRVYYETKICKEFPETQKSVGAMDSGAQFTYTIVSNTRGRLFNPLGILRVCLDGDTSQMLPCHAKRIRFLSVNPLDPDVIASVGDDRNLVISCFGGRQPVVTKTVNLSAHGWSVTWMSKTVVVVGRADGKVDVVDVGGNRPTDHGFDHVDEKVPIVNCHYILNERTLITITNRGCSAYRSGVKYSLVKGSIRSFAFDKSTNKIALGTLVDDEMEYWQYGLEFSARGITIGEKIHVDIPIKSTRMMHGALFQNSAGGECWALYDEDKNRVYIRSTSKSAKPVHAAVKMPDNQEFSQVLATRVMDQNIPKYKITLVSQTKFCQFLIAC